MNEADLMRVLRNIDEKYTAEAAARAAGARMPKHSRRPVLLKLAGALACCGLVIAGFAMRPADEGMNIASKDMQEEMMKVMPDVTTSTAAPLKSTAAQTAPADVTDEQAVTPQTEKQAAEMPQNSETSAPVGRSPSPQEKREDSSDAVSENETETEPVIVTNALPEETSAPETTVTYQKGDVDMDGRITYADDLLTHMICQFAVLKKPELIPLSAEQIALADVHTEKENERTLIGYTQDAEPEPVYLDYPVSQMDICIINHYLLFTRKAHTQIDLAYFEEHYDQLYEEYIELMLQTSGYDRDNPVDSLYAALSPKITNFVYLTAHEDNLRQGIPSTFESSEEPPTWEEICAMLKEIADFDVS